MKREPECGPVVLEKVAYFLCEPGRFAQGAKIIADLPYVSDEAHGKHLFAGFGVPDDESVNRWVHIHLGIAGSLRTPGETGSMGARFTVLPRGGSPRSVQ